MRSILTSLCCAMLALPAFASDGILEINQTCAAGSGCFPGDLPGFPVEIENPGSYRLTSNVTSTTIGIAVTTVVVSPKAVVIDLGGFTLRGPVTCTGFPRPTSCIPSIPPFTGGILHNNDAAAVVRNGTITGFYHGIASLGGFVANLEVEDVRAFHNLGTGIKASGVRNSASEFNFRGGIESNGVVENCRANFNVGSGILGSQAVVVENAVEGNGSNGIDLSDGSVVRSNSVKGNVRDGIVVGRGNLVKDNASTNNGQAGISAISTSSIQNNISQGNTGYGIYMVPELGGPASAFSGNVVQGNTGGTTLNGINMGSNSCNGTTTCP